MVYLKSHSQYLAEAGFKSKSVQFENPHSPLSYTACRVKDMSLKDQYVKPNSN